MGHRTAGRLIAGLVALSAVTACTVGGSAVIAPYRSPAIDRLTASPVRTSVADALALSPDGAVVAVSDPVHGVCLKPVGTGAPGICADLTFAGKHQFSAAFSPDGQHVAVGRDVVEQGQGSVWLVDVGTGKASPVPPGGSSAAAGTTGRPSTTKVPAAATAGSAYTSMIWNAASGHLLLISNSYDADGPATRLIDVDPASLIPRVIVLATGPYEFQSGYLGTGGSKVIFTVYRGDQIPPNVVVVDLGSGVRREFGPLGPKGTQLVPLAVSPDGRQAVVGSATSGDPGPPRLLDLASGALIDIPGLTGNFALAAYSPNGTQLALLSQSATATAVAVAPRSGIRIRTLAGVPSRVVAGSRLTWSAFDTLSITSPAPVVIGSVVGWRLSAR